MVSPDISRRLATAAATDPYSHPVPSPPFLNTVAPFSDNVHSFSRYVATHRDVQTAADITEVSGDANGSEMDHTGGRQMTTAIKLHSHYAR